MLEMGLSVRRHRRLWRRDIDMETTEVTKEMAENKQEWRMVIAGGIEEEVVCCGNSE